MTTVNEMLGQIEERIKAYGKVPMDTLRLEFGAQTIAEARLSTRGKSRVDLIAELIVEEFSLEHDREIE